MKYTLLRRLVQFLILGLFIAGNCYGFKILQGNLSSSVLFGVINLSDPFAVLQLFLASFSLGALSIVGALIIFAFYALIAPRAFCGWVCPINILTDLAAWIRKVLNIQTKMFSVSKNARYYLLVLVLLCSGLFSIAAFEILNFVGFFTRAVVSLSVSAFSIAAIIVIFEIFAGNRIICSHICPLGGFWAIASKFSLIRIFHNANKCTKCNKCKSVCPEVQVLKMVSKESFKIDSECISCGRCVQICDDDALNFSILGVKK
ncbi:MULTISPECIES: quinol dehydrogenase ferredoxin subunit NapH [unclassified Campylobacter]|uniref:quinol dehydrogenase ferredoxin subunit NapH n=1 Tax=unclassified Campylobacter TaxID=2593542 RepID=UPI0022E9FAF2|nr:MULTISPECIES: quinol dehydrogenase ferredoxin subunit NapH [unclassified Campylobacter]MDA3062370.1 quinol dehydrogenase ferredoxin subunit NapH [Campylobacter sp. JMF_14 EL1]MDA3073512.1 quinol dehydrogenase ferredoxin subunit NapH [Campylobacter sp. JMF_10 EL2]